MEQRRSVEELVERVDLIHISVTASQREFLRMLPALDTARVWEQEGARDLAHWVCMRYGVSEWKARRWIDCAYALEHLPRIADALSDGALSLDKCCELTRFATLEDEERLIRWAKGVSCSAISRRAAVHERQALTEQASPDSERRFSAYFYDGGRRFHAEMDLPGLEGVRLMRRLDQRASLVPVMPGEERNACARRADALVSVIDEWSCSSSSSRSSVVIHVRAGEPNATCDDAVVPTEMARRMLCSAKLRVIEEDAAGCVLSMGRASRDPSPALAEQVRYRDTGCVFPRCGTRRHVEVHHIRPWARGGRTDLENLTLVCFFHHKLLHEHGWRLRRERDGTYSWFHPDGTRHRAGPATLFPKVAGEVAHPSTAEMYGATG